MINHCGSTGNWEMLCLEDKNWNWFCVWMRHKGWCGLASYHYLLHLEKASGTGKNNLYYHSVHINMLLSIQEYFLFCNCCFFPFLFHLHVTTRSVFDEDHCLFTSYVALSTHCMMKFIFYTYCCYCDLICFDVVLVLSMMLFWPCLGSVWDFNLNATSYLQRLHIMFQVLQYFCILEVCCICSYCISKHKYHRSRLKSSFGMEVKTNELVHINNKSWAE